MRPRTEGRIIARESADVNGSESALTETQTHSLFIVSSQQESRSVENRTCDTCLVSGA